MRELRLLQKEEQRAQQQLSNKLQQQREQIFRRFEQETTVSLHGRAAASPCFKLNQVTLQQTDSVFMLESFGIIL